MDKKKNKQTKNQQLDNKNKLNDINDMISVAYTDSGHVFNDSNLGQLF